MDVLRELVMVSATCKMVFGDAFVRDTSERAEENQQRASEHAIGHFDRPNIARNGKWQTQGQPRAVGTRRSENQHACVLVNRPQERAVRGHKCPSHQQKQPVKQRPKNGHFPAEATA